MEEKRVSSSLPMSSTTCRSHRRSFRGGNVFWEEWAPHGPRREATKRPAVLVHGLADTCRTWNRVAPALARDRRLYALDLPGHGRTSRYDAAYDVEFYAGLVTDWIRSLGLAEFDLIGHSLGGGIAMRVLLDQPGRVHRLALVAAGGLGLEVALPLRLAATTGLLDLAAPVLMGFGTHAGVRVLGGNFDEEDRKHLAEMNARPGTARALSRTLRNAVDMKGQREHLLDHAHRLAELPPLAVYWGDKESRDPRAPRRARARVPRGRDRAALPEGRPLPAPRSRAGNPVRALPVPRPTPALPARPIGRALAPRSRGAVGLAQDHGREASRCRLIVPVPAVAPGRRPGPQQGLSAPAPGPGCAWTFVEELRDAQFLEQAASRRPANQNSSAAFQLAPLALQSCHRPVGRTAHRAVLPQKVQGTALVRGRGGG